MATIKRKQGGVGGKERYSLEMPTQHQIYTLHSLIFIHWFNIVIKSEVATEQQRSNMAGDPGHQGSNDFQLPMYHQHGYVATGGSCSFAPSCKTALGAVAPGAHPSFVTVAVSAFRLLRSPLC